MSSGSARHAVLFGATGLVGGHLLRLLLAAPDIALVTAVTRRPLPLTHERLINPVGDMGEIRLPDTLGANDVAFCCLGTTIRQAGSREAFFAVDHDLVLRCAGAARQRGVPHFLAVSAIGISKRSPVFYNRVKAETEEGLASLGFPRLTLMQPSLLLGERDGPARLGEQFGIRMTGLLSPLLVGGLSVYTPIDAGDVAAAMLASSRRPDGPSVERLRYREMMALAR